MGKEADVADVVEIHRGFAPWKPSPDAELVKEYRYYDVPRTGVIEQHGVRYFFTCLDDDPDELVSIWFYCHLTREDEAVLDSASAAEFDTCVDFDGPGLLALAFEEVGIVAAEVMDELTSEHLAEAHDALVRRLRSQTEAAQELELA